MELFGRNEGCSISPVDVCPARRKTPSNWLLVPLTFLHSEVKEPPRSTVGNGQTFSSSSSWPSTPCVEGDGNLAASPQGKDERAPKVPEMGLLGQNVLERIAARSLRSMGVCIAHHRGGQITHQEPEAPSTVSRGELAMPAIMWKPVHVKHGQRKEKSYDSWKSTVSYDCYFLFNFCALAKIPPNGVDGGRLLNLVAFFI